MKTLRERVNQVVGTNTRSRDFEKRTLVDEIVRLVDDERQRDLKKLLKMHYVIQRLGLPDMSNPYFDACVDHAAVKLGELVPKPPSSLGGE